MMLRQSARPATPGPRWPAAAAFVFGLCTVAAVFAGQLNRRFYERNQPFYDSMSYHAQVHDVMTRAATEGVGPAIVQACRTSTVCLPLVLAAVAGPFAEPSRGIGITIQWLELLFFAGTLVFYLARIRGLPPASAALAVVPCLAWRCLYEPNGGLSDFRMDLSLALLYATTVLWYLIAIETRTALHCTVLGLSAAAACLCRATAPVYLAIALLPLVVADLVPRVSRRERLRGLVLAAVIAAVGCGWFYLLNYDGLHYYYVVWNTDANAHLPFAEAVKHVEFAGRHVGLPAAGLAVAIPLVWLVDGWCVGRRPLLGHRGLAFDCRMAWIALAPVTLLVSRGAGLNPFVSMPAAFGLTLLLMLPVSGRAGYAYSRMAWIALACLAATSVAGAAGLGWRKHYGDAVDSMAAHREVLRQIVEDARSTGLDDVRFATTHCFYLNQASLQSVALFDTPATRLEKGTPRIEGVVIRPHQVFAAAAEADWVARPGDSTEAKIANMIATAGREIDYLAIPDADTCRFCQENLAFVVINRHATRLRRLLLDSGRWQPVAAEIRNGEHEVVRVYRNVARIATADIR